MSNPSTAPNHIMTESHRTYTLAQPDARLAAFFLVIYSHNNAPHLRTTPAHQPRPAAAAASPGPSRKTNGSAAVAGPTRKLPRGPPSPQTVTHSPSGKASAAVPACLPMSDESSPERPSNTAAPPSASPPGPTHAQATAHFMMGCVWHSEHAEEAATQPAHGSRQSTRACIRRLERKGNEGMQRAARRSCDRSREVRCMSVGECLSACAYAYVYTDVRLACVFGNLAVLGSRGPMRRGPASAMMFRLSLSVHCPGGARATGRAGAVLVTRTHSNTTHALKKTNFTRLPCTSR